MSTITCTNFHQKTNLSSYNDNDYLLLSNGAFLELHDMEEFHGEPEDPTPIRTKVFDNCDVHKYVVFEETGHVLAMTCTLNPYRGELLVRACVIRCEQILAGGYVDPKSQRELFRGPACSQIFQIALIPNSTEVLLLTDSVLSHFRYSFGDNVCLEVVASFPLHSLKVGRFSGRAIVPLCVAASREYSAILSVASVDGMTADGSIVLLQRVAGAWTCRAMQNLDETYRAMMIPGTKLAVLGGQHCKFISTSAQQRGGKGQLRALKQGSQVGEIMSINYSVLDGRTRVYVFGKKAFAVWKIEQGDRISHEGTFDHSLDKIHRTGCSDLGEYYSMKATERKEVGLAVDELPLSTTIISAKISEKESLDIVFISYMGGTVKMFNVKYENCSAQKIRAAKNSDRVITIKEGEQGWLLNASALFQPDKEIRMVTLGSKQTMTAFDGHIIERCELSKSGRVRKTDMIPIEARGKAHVLTSLDTHLVESTGELYTLYGTEDGSLGLFGDTKHVLQKMDSEIKQAFFFGNGHGNEISKRAAYTTNNSLILVSIDMEASQTFLETGKIKYPGVGGEIEMPHIVCHGDNKSQEVWMIYRDRIFGVYAADGSLSDQQIKTCSFGTSPLKIESISKITTRKNEESSTKFANLAFIVREDKQIGVISTVHEGEKRATKINFTKLGKSTSFKSTALHAELIDCAVNGHRMDITVRLYAAKAKGLTINFVQLTVNGQDVVGEMIELGEITTTTIDPSYLVVSGCDKESDRDRPKYGVISGYLGTEVVRICPNRMRIPSKE